MIYRPPVTATLLARQAPLAGDQQPPPVLQIVHLIPGQKVRVLGEQPLQQILGVVVLLAHLDQSSITMDQVYPATYKHSPLPATKHRKWQLLGGVTIAMIPCIPRVIRERPKR
jgi:hypothetical protein